MYSLDVSFRQSDVLLFHRRKQTDGKKSAKKKSGTVEPITPEELESMNVEVLVKEILDHSDKKMEILSEQRLGIAVEDFVAKEHNKAFAEAMKESLGTQQKRLIKRGADAKEGDEDSRVTSAAKVREIVQQESSQRHEADASERDESSKASNGKKSKGRKRSFSANDDEDDDESIVASSSSGRAKGRKRSDTIEDEDEDENESFFGKENGPPAKKSKPAPAKSSARGKKRRDDLSSDDDVVMEPPKKTKTSARSTSRPRRATNKSRISYTVDDSDEEADSESEEVIEIDDDDDDDSLSDVEMPKIGAKKGPSKAKKSQTKKSQTSRTSSQRSRPVYADDSDEDLQESAYGLDDDWGVTNTASER